MNVSAKRGDIPLRILHVLRAPLGGLFRHVLDLTREQVAAGHEVGLVVDSLTGSSSADDNLARLAPILSLGILRLPMRRAPHLQDMAAIVRVDAHARRLAIDVVHGHGSKGGLYARVPAYLPFTLLRRWRPIRCYTPHGGSFNHVAAPLVQATYMGVERLLAARTDVLLFESVYIANVFHKRIGDVSALVRIVQNGISPDEFTPVTPRTDAVSFVYVGELRAAKGIDTLLEALSVVSRGREQPPKLMLVGSGPDKDKLVAHAAALGLADQVTFPGALPAREAFAMGRVLVVPSRAESLPYIILEAAGAQIPIIATDVGGIGEVFGPYRDRLIPSNQPTILAATLEAALARDPACTRAQAAELAAFVAARFSIGNMAAAVIAGYGDAFARRAALADDQRRSFALPL